MVLEHSLPEEQVNHLDLTRFVTVKVGTPVRTTVEKIRTEKGTCAFILDEGSLVGIFTDRDILRKVVDKPEIWHHPIEEVMTPTPITVQSDDQADKALALMEDKHFRNVPVVDEDGRVMGNLTHYAIIKYLSDRFPEAIYNLPPLPDRVARHRDGA